MKKYKKERINNQDMVKVTETVEQTSFVTVDMIDQQIKRLEDELNRMKLEKAEILKAMEPADQPQNDQPAKADQPRDQPAPDQPGQ